MLDIFELVQSQVTWCGEVCVETCCCLGTADVGSWRRGNLEQMSSEMALLHFKIVFALVIFNQFRLQSDILSFPR